MKQTQLTSNIIKVFQAQKELKYYFGKFGNTKIAETISY